MVMQPVTLKPSVMADRMVFKMAWQIYPRKSIITGLWLRDFENSELFMNVFTHVLDKREYPYFRHFIGNIRLTTVAEHSLWENGDEAARLSYCQEVEKQFGGKIRADWSKMEVLVDDLKKLYAESFPYTHKGIVGYHYSLDEQLKILAVLNKKYLDKKIF